MPRRSRLAMRASKVDGRRRLDAEEVGGQHPRRPRVDHARLRAEADEFFSTQNRVSDDAWQHIGA